MASLSSLQSLGLHKLFLKMITSSKTVTLYDANVVTLSALADVSASTVEALRVIPSTILEVKAGLRLQIPDPEAFVEDRRSIQPFHCVGLRMSAQANPDL